MSVLRNLGLTSLAILAACTQAPTATVETPEIIAKKAETANVDLDSVKKRSAVCNVGGQKIASAQSDRGNGIDGKSVSSVFVDASNSSDLKVKIICVITENGVTTTVYDSSTSRKTPYAALRGLGTGYSAAAAKP